MKKYFYLFFTIFLLSCGYGVDSNEVKTILNNHILKTENIAVDGDNPVISKHRDKDSVLVSYLYETYGINEESDSILIFSKRFFVFNKLDLSFRELKLDREDNEFVHYRDLKAKKVRDSLETIRKDNFILAEQNKIIGDIVFGISFEEYQIMKKQFLERTKNVDWVSSDGYKFYKQNIGDYEFEDIKGYFYNEKLYRLDIEGGLISYKYYKSEMHSQVEAIQNPYEKKYGKPDTYFGIPETYKMDEGYSYSVAYWHIGTKKVDLRIEDIGSYYRLHIRISQPKVVNQIKFEEEVNKNAEQKKAKDLL